MTPYDELHRDEEILVSESSEELRSYVYMMHYCEPAG